MQRHFFILACAWALSASPAAAQSPSIDDFVFEPELVDVDLSPDGTKLAIVAQNAQGAAAAVYNLDNPDVPPVTMPIGNTRPFGVEWANNDRLLLKLETGRGWGWRGYTVAVDADGQNPLVLFEDEEKIKEQNRNLTIITDLLPNNPSHILMPARRTLSYDLWQVNIYTGRIVEVERGSRMTYGWISDISGRAAMRLDTDWRLTVVRVFTPNESGKWRRVATLNREDLGEFNALAYTEEPSVLYVSARRDETEGRAAIYRYNVITGQFLERVADDPDVDMSGVHIDPTTGAYRGAMRWVHRLEHDFVDPEMQRHFDLLDEHFGEEVNLNIYSRSEDQRRWVVLVNGPRDPGSYYLYSLDGPSIEPLGLINPHLSPEDLSPMEVVEYQTRDGATIAGYLTRPAGAGPHKLVLMPHGGPQVRDVYSYDMFGQFLASRGYAVFQPNFRGSSGFGEAFTKAGDGEWGGRMQDDLTDAVAALAGRGDIDPAKVCIFGASYGGYAALAGATFTPEVYRCAVSLNGVSDIPDQLSYDRRELENDAFELIRERVGDPRRDSDKLKARSPARHADDVGVPVLLIHGAEDARVPVDQSRDMNKALEKAGKDVRYVEIEGMGHSASSAEQLRQVLQELEAFFAEHLN